MKSSIAAIAMIAAVPVAMATGKPPASNAAAKLSLASGPASEQGKGHGYGYGRDRDNGNGYGYGHDKGRGRGHDIGKGRGHDDDNPDSP
ncbi:hypothetical protein M9978_04030 [Sphingomonas sp. MG17]|uniref:Uncharacterized protein n=1 Tax=Sphingomonas tagetis TaxID=2949092 RepID=A0A9X2HKL2_9SPHN|nr:hypothetical protein [Sphingomonas tagetis]MCP3729589.1 hypothetical protein [Sphingomonas tagetis]